MSKEAPQKKATQYNAYIKYSGMAIQMGLTIGLFVFLGLRLDEWMETQVIFVLIGALLGVGLALYSFIHQAYTDNKK